MSTERLSGELLAMADEDLRVRDERRRPIGLPPIEEETHRRRLAVAQSRERPPQDWAAYQREVEEWLRTVGWRR